MPLHPKIDPEVIKRLQELDQNFKCQQCGNCCRMQEYIGVTGKEIKSIAEYIGVPIPKFRKDFIIGRKGEYLMMEGKQCPFLLLIDGKKAQCLIWPVRPSVCKSFPFFTIETLTNSTKEELVFPPHKLECPELEPYLTKMLGPKKESKEGENENGR